MNPEQIAQNFRNRAHSLAPNPSIQKVIPEKLKDFQLIVWNGETVEEIATGKKISEHKWVRKLAKIDSICNNFLNGEIKQTQILVVKDDSRPDMCIIDGVHRSVGFYKAFLKDPTVVFKTDFTYEFFESDQIRQMYDYNRIFGS